ncbi:MAG: DDE transposase [Desulfobacca sp.]|nr:DDE transposase [Desulfobacca sp.]
MGRGFRGGERNQYMLLPPSLDDWVPEGHLARFISDAVEQMDLTGFYRDYKEEGRPPYDPGMMLGLLLYAYCKGERSSRKISRACEEEIPFRWLSGNVIPDHCSLARFRKRHEEKMKTVFNDVLLLCAEAGLIRLGKVFLDGTKIKAQAALESNRNLSQLGKEIETILREAAAKDQEEDRQYGPDRRGDELPEGFQNRQGRLTRLQEAKARLEAQAKEQRERQEEKHRQRAQEEQETGQKKRGRKPKDPEAAIDQEKKINITDPDSRIMKTRKGYVQGYNAQAVVSEEQIILAADVTQEENDCHQLEPMLKETDRNLEALGYIEKAGSLVADAGYFREDLDIAGLEKTGTQLFLATQKDWKERKTLREQGPPRGRIPSGLSQRERMARRLHTKLGRSTYRLRGQVVEAIFGQIKSVLGFLDFMRRGLPAVQSEWNLICAGHNLLKLYRSGLWAGA